MGGIGRLPAAAREAAIEPAPENRIAGHLACLAQDRPDHRRLASGGAMG